MAYNEITTTEIAAKKPTTNSLWTKVRDNFIYIYNLLTTHTHDGGDTPLISTLNLIVAPSNNYKFASADAEQVSSSQTYVKIKQFKLGECSGGLRVKFGMKHNGGTNLAYGKIYRNGFAVGVEQTVNSTTFVECVDDITGWSAGDTVELWIKNMDGFGDNTIVNNFRLYTDKSYEPKVDIN
ncbi:MAG: hypothetical protein KAS32_15635 [Candidatus Peribacteraceae bacterium]|nr:hypothetical protein [Candidatus Peribacteraceae bacterium]